MVPCVLRNARALTGAALTALFSAAVLACASTAWAQSAVPQSGEASVVLAESDEAPLGAGPVLIAAAAAVPNPADSAPTLGGNHARTRFVIGLEHSVEFQVFSLSDPNRVIVELPDTRMQLPREPATGAAIGLVKAFRCGQSAPGRARVVIDVTIPVVVENARIERSPDGKSQRLALDIVPVDQIGHDGNGGRKAFKIAPAGLGAFGVQPPLPKPAQSPQAKAARAFRPIIVIDPGHGGHDSGAQKNGTVEKDVVLAFSHVLRDQINATGRYKVIMTRDTDVFVDLDERRAFGERNNAALFIAVHADYAQSRAHGATIFSLRESVADELRRSASHHAENTVLSQKQTKAMATADVGVGDVSAVKGILAELADREFDANKERTKIFADAVIETMGSSTGLRNNPDQQAAFRVLKTAQFPSVLIELGYVTNSDDAKLLKSDSWREKVALSIVEAVENYFSNQVAHLPM